MAGLFQRLMELGEEQPVARRLSTSREINAAATREELAAELTSLRAQLVEQTNKYDELFADASVLRSEYDSFRRTAERERRVFVQQRSDDRRMLDELRRAGSSGGMDVVYVREMEARAADMQARLQKCMEAAERAQRRQLEAETSKREDVQRLCKRFEELKETMQQRTNELEKQLLEAREAAEAAGTTTRRETIMNAMPVKGVAVPLSGSAENNSNNNTELDENNKDAGPTSGEPVDTQALLRAASQREKQMRAELLAEQERNQRRVEEAKWESIEAEKKIAELKVEIDTWRSKVVQLEKTLETNEEEYSLKEKDRELAMRQNESVIMRLEQELQEVKQLSEQRRQEYEQALLREQKIETKQTAWTDEVEHLKKAANEALEEQRAEFERRHNERESLLRDQRSGYQALEAALQEMREDNLRQANRIEDLRQELDQAQVTINDLGLMQVQSQRLIQLREEEVVSKEEERQNLRRQLREEEEAHAHTRERLMDMERRYKHGAETLHCRDMMTTVSEEPVGKPTLLEKNIPTDENKVTSAQEVEIQRKDNIIRQLQIQLDDLIANNAKFAYYREEQTAKTRQLEARIRELEVERFAASAQRLQAENVSTHERSNGRHSVTAESSFGPASSPAFEVLYIAPSERDRQQFVSQAVMSAQKIRYSASYRFRRLIMVSLLCIITVVFITTYFAVSPGVETLGAAEAEMEMLKERYTLTSKALSLCQSRLSVCQQP